MRNRISNIWSKHREVLLYLIFGVLTTVVNYVVYLPLHSAGALFASVANVIAWVVAVIFAYLTNKPFVFDSKDWSWKTVLPEFTKFVGARMGSLVVETLILLLCVDILSWNGVIMKLVTSVLVVVLNYISSKFLVFKKDR